MTPICAFDLSAEGRVAAVTTVAPATGPAALSLDPAKGFTFRWLHFDLTDPAFHDWTAARLPPVIASALRQTHTRPRCIRVGNGVGLNLRGVNLNPEGRVEDMVALRVWMTESVVVTARMRPLMTVDAIRAEIAEGRPPRSPADLIERLARGLIERMEEVALRLELRTDAQEDDLFSDGPDAHIGAGEQAEDVDEIVAIRRSVIILRRFAKPQREALSDLAAIDDAFLTEDERIALNEVANRAARLSEAFDLLHERLDLLQDHADSRADQAMTRNSYVLSIVAAIFLPLGFFTGLFGVNLAGMPGTGNIWAFTLLCFGMAALGAGLLALFRWRDWL